VVDTRIKPIGHSYALVIGSSDRQGLVGQPLNIEIATKNVLSNQLQVEVSDQFNKTYGARITDNGDSTFTCSFVPSFSGRYTIDILLDDNAIGGGPVSFVAMDVPDSTTTTAAATPKRDFSRSSTSQTKERAENSPAPTNIGLTAKSKELDEVKTQKEAGKTRKERTTGSQTHREVVPAEKPRKKKKTTSSTDKSSPGKTKKSPSKKTGTTTTTTTTATKKKASPSKTKKPVQDEEGSDEQIQEEPEEPRDEDDE